MILLVEDNEDDVFLMRRALLRVPVSEPMHVAINGREALHYLQGVGKYNDRATFPIPSVIFLDLKLPLVHGFEVLTWIRKEPALNHVPVAVLSSSPEERDHKKAYELGAKTFLVKPPTPEMLQKAFALLAPCHAASRAGC